PGGAGQAGGNGPDVTVRLAILRSRFYDKLIVAAVEVGYSRPYYVFADGNTIPPANWLWVESRGGRGGAGTSGQNGGDGAAGQKGAAGPNGSEGAPGPRPQIVTLPTGELFGPNIAPELAALLERAAERPRRP